MLASDGRPTVRVFSHRSTGGSARPLTLPRPGIMSHYASSIEALGRCIERCHGHLIEQRTAFAERRRQAADLKRNHTQMACLDVGGTRFHTQRAVLTGAGGGQHKGEEHFFGTLMAGCFVCEEDDEGYIFIDRDPTLFVRLLEYLRGGELWVPRDRRLALLREVRYFGMRRLEGHIRRPTRQYLLTLKSGSIQVYNGDRWRTLRTTAGRCNQLMTWGGRLFAFKHSGRSTVFEEMSAVSGEWRRVCDWPWPSDPPQHLVIVGNSALSDGEREHCELYVACYQFPWRVAHWDGRCWRLLPSSPRPLGTVGAVWGDQILAVGGTHLAVGGCHKSVQMYSTKSGRWKLLPAQMSCARANPTVVMWHGKLVVAGGGTGRLSASVEAFDMRRRQWENVGTQMQLMTPTLHILKPKRQRPSGLAVSRRQMGAKWRHDRSHLGVSYHATQGQNQWWPHNPSRLGVPKEGIWSAAGPHYLPTALPHIMHGASRRRSKANHTSLKRNST